MATKALKGPSTKKSSKSAVAFLFLFADRFLKGPIRLRFFTVLVMALTKAAKNVLPRFLKVGMREKVASKDW